MRLQKDQHVEFISRDECDKISKIGSVNKISLTFSGFMYKPVMPESTDDSKEPSCLLAHASSSCTCVKTVLSKVPSEALVDFQVQGLIYPYFTTIHII